MFSTYDPKISPEQKTTILAIEKKLNNLHQHQLEEMETLRKKNLRELLLEQYVLPESDKHLTPFGIAIRDYIRANHQDSNKNIIDNTDFDPDFIQTIYNAYEEYVFSYPPFSIEKNREKAKGIVESFLREKTKEIESFLQDLTHYSESVHALVKQVNDLQPSDNASPETIATVQAQFLAINDDATRLKKTMDHLFDKGHPASLRHKACAIIANILVFGLLAAATALLIVAPPAGALAVASIVLFALTTSCLLPAGTIGGGLLFFGKGVEKQPEKAYMVTQKVLQSYDKELEETTKKIKLK